MQITTSLGKNTVLLIDIALHFHDLYYYSNKRFNCVFTTQKSKLNKGSHHG